MHLAAIVLALLSPVALTHVLALLSPVALTHVLALVLPLAIFAWTLPLPLVVQAVLVVVLPILVGLVTTRVTRAGLKAVLLLALNVVASFFNELASSLASSSPFDVGLWLLYALGTFGLGVAVHYGLLKPTGVTAAAQRTLIKE